MSPVLTFFSKATLSDKQSALVAQLDSFGVAIFFANVLQIVRD